MSSTPFMQLYPADYLADTMDLTTEQHGAYLLILMTMWQHDAKLPSDIKKLARIARLSPAKFRPVWEEISRFFIEADGFITNARLTKERKKAHEKSAKRAIAGSAGGKAKALKDKATADSNCHANAMASSSDTRDQIEERKEAKASSSAKPTVPGPSFDDFWAVWPLGKIAKQDAAKAFKKLSAESRRLAIDRAPAWAAQWRRDHPHANPIHPARYLNGTRWTDEIQPTLTLIPGGTREPSRQDHRAPSHAHPTDRAIAFASRAVRTPSKDCF
ncbi:DUF1376 domain-containing protein [Paracoccus sp. SY]|uniref:YdaU family protein n=1 Tax=Paracoccus sp. SY TaxID=1330255 RepID=UPI000CD2D463|nr:DUF1376 domain-containing protein [Paracoccus sp. SY]